MAIHSAAAVAPDPGTVAFYRRSLEVLQQAGIPFLVGGAYAFERYTGIARHTKDLDLFVGEDTLRAVLDTLAAAGYPTEFTFPHWLGKAFCGDAFIDVIFGAGNGIARVDAAWFEHAVPDRVFGVPVRLIAAEEMIWSKAFIMERERFDGADIAHLLRARARMLDWPRLMSRFGDHWRVLLAHLVMFDYIYPDRSDAIPGEVLHALVARLASDEPPIDPTAQPVCRGTLVSREQYLHDVHDLGYVDARLRPHGTMQQEDVDDWTEAIWNGRSDVPQAEQQIGRRSGEIERRIKDRRSQ